jgi:hypothetical protein
MLAKNFLEISALTIRARPSGREPGWAEPRPLDRAKKTIEYFWDLKELGSEPDGLLVA